MEKKEVKVEGGGKICSWLEEETSLTDNIL